MATYDLLTEPWIPVRGPDGVTRELGLLDVLKQAHDLVEVTDPAPPFELGIYRLLIAFVLDALRLEELDDLVERLAAGRFDAAELMAYVDRVGRRRFDLFDTGHPFLQSASGTGDRELDTVAMLFHHLPTGLIHFHHQLADQHAVSAAVCARALCSIAPFMTAGGRGYSPSINGTPPWYLLIRGNRLFETILLNCYVLSDLGLPGNTPVAWRDDQPVEQVELACGSLLEGLTWRARWVRLIPAEGGPCTYSGKHADFRVSRIHFGPGFMFRGGARGWTDPAVAYRMTDNGRSPIRPEEDRELWRDTGPLLLLRQEDHSGEKGRVAFTRPLIAEQFRWMKERGYLSPAILEDRFDVYGMRTDKCKVFEWYHERLALDPRVGSQPRAGLLVRQAMDLAESVAYALGRALKVAYPRNAASNGRAFDRLIQVAQARFWSDLRLEFERQYLPTLAGLDPADPNAEAQLCADWKAAVSGVGRRALDDATRPLDVDAKALLRRVACVQAFSGALWALLNPAAAASKKKERGKKKV